MTGSTRSGTDPVLFLVPARGGSVRLPGKHFLELAGLPLIAHGVLLARRAARLVPGGPHAVVCSTDDPEIAEAARSWGAEIPWLRPAELARPETLSVDVVIHAIDALEAAGRRFRASVLVQATSPLTTPSDVAAAVAAFDAGDGRGVVGIVGSHPGGWHLRRDAEGTLLDAPAGDDRRWIPSGGVYVSHPDRVRASRKLIEPGGTTGMPLPAERYVDIDEADDLALAAVRLARRPFRRITLGEQELGGDRTYVIAEAGVNHDGDVDVARRLVDAAADAGADAVKFQTFDPDQLAAAGAATADYQRRAGATGDQRAMLAALALPAEAWAGLRDHAADRGLAFLSTPFDEGSAALLAELGVPAFKVGSGELTNLPFLEALARRGLPMLVSTGMATMLEVAEAVEAITAAGDPPLALLHCVSAYPADPRDANLRSIGTMRGAFGLPVGWSDHTPGIETAIAAVALGASIVEKHLTLDRARSGPDHAASLEPGAFRDLVAAIRTTEAALGNGSKAPVEAERPIAAVARRSVHWRHDLAAGAPISAEDLVALRPGTGIPPGGMRPLVGRRTRRPVRAGSLVDPEDVTDGSGG